MPRKPIRAGRRVYIWDDQLPGFRPANLAHRRAVLHFQIQVQRGADRRATVGKYGALTPDEARATADDMRRAVAAGRDPLAEKRERRNVPAMGDLFDAYLASATFAGKAGSTQLTDRGRIERHLRPLLGAKRVNAVTLEDVKRLTLRSVRAAPPRQKRWGRAPWRVCAVAKALPDKVSGS